MSRRLCYLNRVIKYPKLEGTRKAHSLGSMSDYTRPPKNETMCLRELSEHFLNSGRLGTVPTSLGSLSHCPTTPSFPNSQSEPLNTALCHFLACSICQIFCGNLKWSKAFIKKNCSWKKYQYWSPQIVVRTFFKIFLISRWQLFQLALDYLNICSH